MAMILLVEDEKDLSNLLRRTLESEGYQVLQAFTGREGLRLAEATALDLIILDWMLPEMDGLAVCRQLRLTHLTPILMLTARSDEIDRVVGLEVGADDYLVKPVSLRELTARVRAMLRRVEMDSKAFSAPNSKQQAEKEAGVNSAAPLANPVIEFKELRLYPQDRRVTLAGAELELTPKEYELLKLMVAHPGRAFSREYLLEQIWGYEYDGVDRTVDTHIQRLRKKLGVLGENISTVWGVGYRFAHHN
jgi:DNA-binding response OmpR family regulator